MVPFSATNSLSRIASFGGDDINPWGARTPSDILYYLFGMANDSDNTPTTAVAVSQVCRRWRDVAIASPKLWTNISMWCIRARQQHCWTVIRLRRSQNLPIAFNLKAHRKLTPREIEVVFTRHAHRFHRLNVLASNYQLTFTLWPQFSQLMPALKQLEYRVIGDIRVHIHRELPRALTPFQIPGGSRHGIIEWSRWNATTITSLTLNYIGPESKLSVRDFREIFSHCRRTLKHIELLGFAPTYDKKHPEAQITLPALETMNLGYIDNIVPFVELVRTPNLQSFTLRDIIRTPENSIYKPTRDWYSGMERTDAGRIFELLQGVPLTHLAIYGERFDHNAQFRQLLLAMTGLKSLTLYAAEDTYYEVLFDRATAADALLPSLSELLVTHVDHTRSLPPFFLRRLAAGLPPLWKLTITNDCVTLIEAEGLLEGVMNGCSSITAITDPMLEMYNVVAEGERDIVVNGVVV
jgi:hypothetical protein